MDPTYIPILSAIGGGGMVAIVDQFALHRRTQSDRGEAARAIQRDAAGDLLTAADALSWELVIARSSGTFAAGSRQSGRDPQLIALTKAQRRLDAEIRRAHVVITDPEPRAVVVSLHAAMEAFHDELRGEDPVDGVKWAERLETTLDGLTDELQATSERILKPGGPPRQSRLRWRRRKSGHAAGGA